MQEEIRTLAAYMAWADASVWKAVLGSEAKDDASLLDTLFHLHLVQHAFCQAWSGEPVTMPERSSFASAEALAQWGQAAHEAMGTYFASGGLAAPGSAFVVPWSVRFEKRTGRPAATHTLGESWTQAVLHTQHHRGQVCSRLRALGLTPPAVDFIVWLWSGRPSAEWL